MSNMKSWYSIFPKSPWLSIYAWAVFCFLPFFFIFRSSSRYEIAIGISLLLLFFLSYRFSYKSKSGLVYMWISFEIIINVVMTLLFGYLYLSIFTAFFHWKYTKSSRFFHHVWSTYCLNNCCDCVWFLYRNRLIFTANSFHPHLGAWYGAFAVQFVQSKQT